MQEEFNQEADTTKSRRRWQRIGLASLVLLVALVLRVSAVTRLPLDYDEPIYLGVAAGYAEAVQQGNWSAILNSQANIEHPLLVKLVYAAGMILLGPQATPTEAGAMARFVSAGLGALAAGALALVSPLAGLALAVHTMTIKYTSQAYLEAIPLFAVTVSMLAYRQSRGRRGGWFWLSAAMMGVTAAGKYTYLVAALALLPFLLTGREPTAGPADGRAAGGRRPPLLSAALYIGVAAAVFVLLDPILWPNPPVRLWESITFHVGYSQGGDVQRAALPWYQQWLFMSRSVPWHPGVFLVSLDTVIFFLGAGGLFFLVRREPLAAVWLGLSWLWLTFWPTKWPQYTLIAVVPLCLSTSVAVAFLLELARQRGLEWHKLRAWLPGRSFWLILVSVVAVILGLYFFYGLQRFWERRDWFSISTHNSGLPDDWVQTIALGSAGDAWLGTPVGLVHLADEEWQFYTADNSDLAHDDVHALLLEDDGTLWVGSRTALQRLICRPSCQGPAIDAWQMVTEAELVNGLALEPASGRAWAATSAGLLRVEPGAATRLTVRDGLAADNVLDVAVGADGSIWAATYQGVSVWDGTVWRTYTASNSGLSWSGVAAVEVDSAGRVWLGTLGGGVTTVQGEDWRTYTTSNSGLPWNFVTTILDDGQGHIWFGADMPAGGGGNLAVFDHAACAGGPDDCPDAWTVYTPLNSGAPDSAVESIAVTAGGQVWIGTRSAGIAVFQPSD